MHKYICLNCFHDWNTVNDRKVLRCSVCHLGLYHVLTLDADALFEAVDGILTLFLRRHVGVSQFR